MTLGAAACANEGGDQTNVASFDAGNIAVENAASFDPGNISVESGVEVAASEYAMAELSDQALNLLIEKLPKFRSASGIEYVIFEGDLRYTPEAVRNVIRQRAKMNRLGRSTSSPEEGVLKSMLSNKLHVFQPDLKIKIPDHGGPVVWPVGSRNLTYAVDKASFAPIPGLYDVAVQKIRQAASEWEALCSHCGVTIRYRPEFDVAPNPNQVTFVVHFDPSPSPTFALAFFPADPKPDRVLTVYSKFRRQTYDQAGIFRHEIGHILGYAHEHSGERTGCEGTGENWRLITDTYDPKSVMHYVCGSEQDAKFKFTDLDEVGHSRAYGEN